MTLWVDFSCPSDYRKLTGKPGTNEIFFSKNFFFLVTEPNLDKVLQHVSHTSKAAPETLVKEQIGFMC